MAKRILIIDDDPDFVEAVATLLGAKGYEVNTANNGEDGYKLAKKIKPNLITLDVMMANDSEGFDTSKKIGADPEINNIPVILVSGIKKVADLTYNYETGKKIIPVKAVLEKPIDAEMFLKTVENYIK
ncbi:MAG: response regulator [Candidatus Omnitrophica bacterium]|nr:response regulator [Candidatus Omnitrophota bacterium]